MPCETCMKLRVNYNKEEDCANCLPPLMDENQEAIFIWSIVRDQVITAGMDGEVIALNQLAVWEAIDRYKIKNQTQCFDKVRKVFYFLLEKHRLERSQPTENDPMG